MSKPSEHKALIERFYTAFQNLDAEGMAACYAPDVVFEDPAFGELHGAQAADMWRMLLKRSGGNLKIVFSELEADEAAGSARWDAHYLFSKTKRPVHNIIYARFKFKDGLIVDHRDHFDFHRWARQALGFPGLLLGWTSFLKNKVQMTAWSELAKFQAAKTA
jgi:limonene-1,2-epoxide hydrolase